MTWTEKLKNMNMSRPSALRRPAPPLPSGARKAKEWKHLNLRQLQGLRNLLFSAREIVEGAYSGRHRSPFKGSSPEFVDYREYYPGDDLRTIDWKAVARTDRLFIRLFEKKTDMNCYLMVDTSASMEYGGKAGAPFLDHKNVSKLDYALCMASALAYLMIKQGDKASLTLFADRIGHHFPPGGTFGHLYGMLNLMELQKAAGRTKVSKALHDAFPICRRKGLLILLSDLAEEDPAFYAALNLYRHRGFEIIIFHILHPHELTLPPQPSVNFVDSESGVTINSHPAEIAESYRQNIRAWIDEMRRGAQSRRIDYHLVNTETPYEAVLNQYLLRRSRL